MSTVGLTKAEHDRLRCAERGERIAPDAVRFRLRERVLLFADDTLSPRGHAALAAPRMTQGDYEILRLADLSIAPIATKRTIDRGWITPFGELTPAGRTALNNVRAAMGSPDWKEDV